MWEGNINTTKKGASTACKNKASQMGYEFWMVIEKFILNLHLYEGAEYAETHTT